MQLTAKDLKGILEVAQDAIQHNESNFNYTVNENYGFFIWMDWDHEDRIWVIEANKIDKDDTWNILGYWNEVAPYADVAQILIACERSAEQNFKN